MNSLPNISSKQVSEIALTRLLEAAAAARGQVVNYAQLACRIKAIRRNWDQYPQVALAELRMALRNA